jgi:hypothetical protein
MSQDSKYTKPGLRENIKDRVMAGSKGGKPGQWSARKAQLVAQEYEKAGGGYKGGKGEEQKSLEKWGKEKSWQERGKELEVRKLITSGKYAGTAFCSQTPTAISAIKMVFQKC